MENNRTNFWIRNNYSWEVPISHIIQNYWKNQLYYELFSFNLAVKYIQLYNFCLWNCLWSRNAYRLVVWKVFPFQAKCYSDKKYQNDVLCGNMNMEMSPLTYWNLNSSTKILVLQLLLGFILVYYSQKEKWYTFPNRFV